MSPIPFTPQQLGRALQVDNDQQRWKCRDLATIQGVREGIQMIRVISRSEYNAGHRSIFACEFAALYLPQFIARYLWLMEVDGTAGSSLTLLHTLATAPSFFGRWVRLNLEEAVRLFIVLARDAIQKWPTMPIVKGSDHNGDPTFSFIVQTTRIMNVIVLGFPPPYDTQAWPLLPSSLSLPLDVTAKLAHQKINSYQHDDEIHIALGELHALSDFCNGQTSAQLRGTGLVDERAYWWTCDEATRRGVGVTGKTPCVSLKDGEELLACSRCLAVRFCSQAHQRASWPSHKKICFKPTW
ncbi:hypothetical protein BDY24DRAFT_370114 [Mrakia frigida]|uniref:zinc finger MYND domain-containing protein n=1 Tax=Mrakia frigida TaxID=29902 RepID=UPI003FCBF6FE